MFTDEQLAIFRRHMESREKRDLAKEAAEEAEKEYRDSEAEMWDMLTRDGELEMKDASIKVPLGPPYGTVTFSPRETFYGRVIDDEAALEWFENTARVDEFTKPGIVMARVNEHVRGIIERKEESFPPGIDFRAQRGVAITRPKPSKKKKGAE